MKFENNRLIIKDAIVKEFESPISSIVEFENCVVVLLDSDFYKKDNENVFCINKNGKLIWQVPKYEYIDKESPFISISKDFENIKLWNWDSSFVLIEPESGKIIMTPFEYRKGRRPW